MNWSKLDARLAAALGPGSDDRPLSVFVHVDPAGADAGVCDRLGLGPPAREIVTATLSPEQVAELSELPWVRRLALSGHLRLLDDG